MDELTQPMQHCIVSILQTAQCNHCTLHTAHCALDTTHCTLRTAVTANCPLHTRRCTLQQGLTWHTPRDTDGPTDTRHTNTYKIHGAWHDTQQETEDTDGSTWSYVTERSRAVALGMDEMTQPMQHCIVSILLTAHSLVFETFLKLGKLQCKFNFSRYDVHLLRIENFETIQIVLYLPVGYGI